MREEAGFSLTQEEQQQLLDELVDMSGSQLSDTDGSGAAAEYDVSENAESVRKSTVNSTCYRKVFLGGSSFESVRTLFQSTNCPFEQSGADIREAERPPSMPVLDMQAAFQDVVPVHSAENVCQHGSTSLLTSLIGICYHYVFLVTNVFRS